MASISLKNVNKIYHGGIQAVKDFNLEIPDKEFVVFVGPSGCGKTTTLRLIAGLESISSGELYINGKLVNKVEPKDRDIAMVFQSYALYPHMTVYENMAFGLRVRRVPKKEADRIIKEAAIILGIEEYLDRKPKQLSGGQMQRVALGRAIVRKPAAFLLDEPLSNLDAKMRSQMRTELNRLHKDLEATFVYVTHDQVEAMTMGTLIVVMKDGCIQQADNSYNLYRYPVNKFVAGFIGTPQMNFLDVSISIKGEKPFARFLKSEIPLSEKLSGRVKCDKEYILGARAEDICISSENSSLIGKIKVLEHLGNETLLYITIEGKPDYIIARTGKKRIYVPGEEIGLSFDAENIILFDKETEENVLGRN